MRGRRPPDILKKSHAHGSGKARAKGKAALKRELETETGVEERDATLKDDKQAPRLMDDKAESRD